MWYFTWSKNISLKENEEVVESLSDRIEGRVALNDIVDPINGNIIVNAGEEITKSDALKIESSPIESVEVRSALTCESKKEFVQNATVVIWQMEIWFKW